MDHVVYTYVNKGLNSILFYLFVFFCIYHFVIYIKIMFIFCHRVITQTIRVILTIISTQKEKWKHLTCKINLYYYKYF